MAKFTLADIRAHNENAGRFYFSKGATKFFGSKYHRTIYQGPGGVFFVDTTTPPHGAPYHNVAEYNPETGDVRNRAGLGSLDTARALAKTLAKGA